MPVRFRALHFLRQLHLYVGVFTAPALLFFAFTGALQTFSLHELSKDGSYKPERWVVVLAQIHKKQTAQLPAPKSNLNPGRPTRESAKIDSQAPAASSAQRAHNPLPLKIFFLIVAAGLMLSTVSGLYMAWTYKRNKVVLCLLFAAGIVTPVLMIVL